MVMDPTVQDEIDEAEFEAEMEELFTERPMYRGQGGRTNPEVESTRARGIESTAAEIEMWNRETGVMSLVLFDAIKARRRQRFPEDYPDPRFAGQRVFTLHRHGCDCGKQNCDPAPEVLAGTLACPLSRFASAEQQAEVKAIGFGGRITCGKPAYFLNDYDVDLHVEKAHPRYYTLRERYREREERQRDREEQRALRQSLAGLAQPASRRGKAAE